MKSSIRSSFEIIGLLRILVIYQNYIELIGATDFMIKAVLFDLDGVLVSTDEYHYRIMEKTFR